MFPSNKEELERVRKACRSMVTKRAVVSAGAALVPIPGTDIAADMGLLLDLIPRINRRFGLAPDQIDQLDAQTKVLIYKIIKSVGGRLAGQVITEQIILKVLGKVGTRMATKQIVKLVPLAGQVASVLLGLAAMMYVGNSHVDECYEIVKRIIQDRASPSDYSGGPATN